MKMFRWTGLIMFIVITGVITGGIVFLAESYIREAAESQLTEANGAKVEMDSLKISYTPFSIKINNIQVTDPQRPMTNSVQIDQIIMTASIGDLFLRKLNISEMSVNGIRVDTARSSSGEISKVAKKSITTKTEAEDSTFDIPEIELPDVKELLKKEPLNSEKLISALNEDINDTQKEWQTTKDELGDKKRWNQYDADYSKIQKGFKGNFKDKFKAAKTAKDLIKALKNEAKRIKQAKNQIKNDIDRLDASFKQVKSAPGDDIRRIKQKYKLDDISSGNVSQLLFGAQTAEYIATARKWYDRVEPYLGDDDEEVEVVKERSKGKDIKFREYNPKPGVYVRLATIDADLPRGKFAGEITELSSDQSINKKPTKFLIEGKGLSNREYEKVSGEFNYITKANGYSKLDYVIGKYQVVNYSLSKSDKLPLSINTGLMDLDLRVKLDSAGLTGSTKVDLTKVEFYSKPTQGGSLASMITSSFTDISEFNINADFKGSLDDFSLHLSSDLDNKIGDKFKSRLRQRSKEFEEELKQGVLDKLKEPMDKIEAKRQQLEQVKAEVDKKEQELNQKIAKLKKQIKF